MSGAHESGRRPWIALVALVVISAGLGSRSASAALPEFLSSYTGDTLWASLVFLLLALAMPGRRAPGLAAIAISIAFAVEFLQLYQAPWLNAIRDTLPGRLVLGQGFLFSDLLCYTLGIALTAILFQLIAEHNLRGAPTIICGAVAITIIVAVVASNVGEGSQLLGFVDRIPGRDKTGHFLLMGALSFSAVLAIAPRLRSSPAKASCHVILALCAIISIEELSQYFITTRNFSIADLLASLAGAGIFGWLAQWLVSTTAKRNARPNAGKI